jgi:uncharacterized protein with FMN-binding domain
MRRSVLAILSTIAGLVLLLTFKTQSTSTPAIATPPAAISPSTGSTGSSGSSTGTGTGSATKTVTGAAAETRYGPVQVQITVKSGQLTAVTATEYPSNDSRDQEINSYAIPQLNQEATAARNAQIDTVSGATYTSEGYITSLQSAMDQAGLA